MSGPTRTNHDYAHLAYQGAIIDLVVEHLMEYYVGNETASPAKEIECVQLVREDSIVPLPELLHFVDDLKSRKAAIDHELSKFVFVRRSDEPGFGSKPSHRALYADQRIASAQPQGAPGNGVSVKKRRRKRGSRNQ